MEQQQASTLESADDESDTVAATVALLCCAPALRHSPVQHLWRLARSASRAAFAPGDLLLEEGREPAGVYVVVSGRGRLYAAGAPARTAVELGTR